MSSENVFINKHTLSQWNNSSTFKEMDGYVENGDVIIGYGYVNIQTIYQHIGF